MSDANSEAAAGARALRGVLPAGTRLQKYELTSVLGQGSFGITYLGRDTQLNRNVAIKEYLPIALALRDNDTMVQPRSTELAEEFVWGRDRFLEEARTLAMFGETPAIVRVHDFMEANGTAYMVMALVRGETLEQQLKRAGPLSSAAVGRLLPPLLEGLSEVHATDFLHRDIKPANVMIDAKGLPTLIDFGASRAAMAGRTTAMTAVFTPDYAAAEQFISAKQGPWTDIYGLAATLHCAVTGKPPPAAIARTLDDEYVPLMSAPPAGFAPGLLAGIDAGLAVRASARPQSIADWRRILDSGAAGGTVVLPRGQAGPNPTPVVKPSVPAAVPPADVLAKVVEQAAPAGVAARQRWMGRRMLGGLAVVALVVVATLSFVTYQSNLANREREREIAALKEKALVATREAAERERVEREKKQAEVARQALTAKEAAEKAFRENEALRTMVADNGKSRWLLWITSGSFDSSGSLPTANLRYLVNIARGWTTVALYYEPNRATTELATRLKLSLVTSGVPESKIVLVTHGQCASETCAIEVRGLNLK